MKKNRLYFGVLLLLLLIAAASYGMLHAGRREKTYNISVIVDDSNNDRWIAFHQGLEQAAAAQNMNVSFVSTGKLTDTQEQLALIEREIENGADGILVQMVGGAQPMKELEQAAARAAVMLVETNVAPEGVYAFTGPDNRAMGAALAQAVCDDLGGELSGKKIGVFSGSMQKLSTQQRLLGFQEEIAQTGAEIIWTVENQADGAQKTKLPEQEEADIVVALENEETERMVDSVLSGTQQTGSLLYGIGCSEKAVYYLDKGVIRVLVVPNEFHMGYQGMQALAWQLQYHLAKAEDSETGYLVVDQEKLYEESNQKILFPIVQ